MPLTRGNLTDTVQQEFYTGWTVTSLVVRSNENNETLASKSLDTVFSLIGNKLYAIYPNVGNYQCKIPVTSGCYRPTNQQTSYWSYSTYTLLSIGQGMINQYVLLVSPRSLLSTFSLNVFNFAAIRSRYFSASSMKDVSENVNAQSVIDFIKEINFYHEL